MIGLPYLLGIKAEALHLADRTSEALEAIREAEATCAEYRRQKANASGGRGFRLHLV
jgi:hypothetical protein